MRSLTLAAFALGALGLVLITAAVGAFTVDSTTQRMLVRQESIKSERKVVVTLNGNGTAGSSRNGNGLSCPGREATTNNPVVRNDWVLDNLLYMTLMQEDKDNSWPVGRIYKVDVYGDGDPITTLYFKNDTAEAAVEGVRVRVDVGATGDAPQSYSTVVTRLNACP